MENIDRADMRSFKKLAKVMLSASERQIEIMLEKGEIEEVKL